MAFIKNSKSEGSYVYMDTSHQIKSLIKIKMLHVYTAFRLL